MADPNVSSNLVRRRRATPPGKAKKAAGAKSARDFAPGRTKPSEAALAGIRARGKAKFGKDPSEAAVMATYRRNQERAKSRTRGERVVGQRRALPKPPPFVGQRAIGLPPGQAKKAAGAQSARDFAPRGAPRQVRGFSPPLPIPGSQAGGRPNPTTGSSSRLLGPPTPFPGGNTTGGRLIGPPVGGSGSRKRLGNPSPRREGGGYR